MTKKRTDNPFTIVKKLLAKQNFGLTKLYAKVEKYETDFTQGTVFRQIFDFTLSEIAKYFNIEKVECIIFNREHEYTVPRKLGMIFIKKYTNATPSQIADLFDGRSRQNLYTIIREFEALDANNEYDRKNFLDAYGELDIRIEKFTNDNNLKFN